MLAAVAVIPAAQAARPATKREIAATRAALAAYLRAQGAKGTRFTTHPTCVSTERRGFAVAWTWLVRNGRLLTPAGISYLRLRAAVGGR